eukprot:Transcript_3410.p2 GENE.Transcript_3410~~Transcript_3410.p2  ORF type:complete len:201 (-),score=61.38 Transcript_3410:1527-2129(-)
MGCGSSTAAAAQPNETPPAKAPPTAASATEADKDKAAALIQSAAASTMESAPPAATTAPAPAPAPTPAPAPAPAVASEAAVPAPAAAAPATSDDAARYDAIIADHKEIIEALFQKIDKDSDGFLVASELKDVVEKFNGESFNEEEFFGWFDVHGGDGKPDHQLDLKEFGWYVADIAESFSDESPDLLVPSIVKDLEKKCE